MTCQNAADESGTGLRCARLCRPTIMPVEISRFGRQARPGERVDSGLTAFRLSEFATLDKTRQKYKTRLGRFITSPRRLVALRYPRRHHNFHTLFWGQTPCCVGPGPKSVLKNPRY